MIDGSNIVITGGLGAIGSALSRALLLQNIQTLTILDDCSSGSRYLCRDILSDGRVKYFQKSILNDEVLRRIFLENSQNIVIHLAAHFANQNSIEHPITDCEVNSVGTMKILEYSRLGEVQKFIFASSSCVYGNSDNFAVDTLQFHLDTPYAINKLHGEYLVRFYHDFHGLNTTVLRLFNSFGPGELPGKYRNVIPNFFATAMKGLPLPITGDRNASRDFNYIDNLIQAIFLSIHNQNSSGKIYNIGSGVETTIGNLADLINEITQNTAGIIEMQKRDWDTVLKRKADISLTIQDLGYRPVIDLKNQLVATYEWLQRYEHYFL